MRFRGRTWKSDDLGLLDHLEEFRGRILWTLLVLAVGTVIGFAVVVKFNVLALLIIPIKPYLNGGKLKYLSPADPFMITLRLAVAVGVVVTLPVALYHLWSFLSPLLDKSERKVVLPAVFGAVFLFAAGATLAYVGVFPITLRFFGTFEPGSLEQNLTVDKLMGYLMKLLLGFGIAFETPVIMLALAVMGIVTSDMLVRYRRHAIVAIFILGAALTPPDVFSQMLMAVPLLFLYEASIWLVRWAERRRAATLAESGDGEGERASTEPASDAASDAAKDPSAAPDTAGVTPGGDDPDAGASGTPPGDTER